METTLISRKEFLESGLRPVHPINISYPNRYCHSCRSLLPLNSTVRLSVCRHPFCVACILKHLDEKDRRGDFNNYCPACHILLYERTSPTDGLEEGEIVEERDDALRFIAFVRERTPIYSFSAQPPVSRLMSSRLNGNETWNILCGHWHQLESMTLFDDQDRAKATDDFTTVASVTDSCLREEPAGSRSEVLRWIYHQLMFYTKSRPENKRRWVAAFLGLMMLGVDSRGCDEPFSRLLFCFVEGIVDPRYGPRHPQWANIWPKDQMVQQAFPGAREIQSTLRELNMARMGEETAGAAHLEMSDDAADEDGDPGWPS